jgi:hypothetical protein
MRATLIVLYFFLTACSSVQQGFKKGFDKSFLEKCAKAAKEKGATEARAKEYCQCTLAKVNTGSSIDKAAESCQ